MYTLFVSNGHTFLRALDTPSHGDIQLAIDTLKTGVVFRVEFNGADLTLAFAI